jgi:hypothetical protein
MVRFIQAGTTSKSREVDVQVARLRISTMNDDLAVAGGDPRAG